MQWIFGALAFLIVMIPVAQAEVGLGAIGRYHISANYSASSDVPGESINGQSGYSVGAMIFLPVLPWFSARLGFDIEQLKIADSVPGGSTDDITLQNLLIPLDLQFNLIGTGLYAYGGVIPDVNIGHTASASGETFATHPDVRLDVGVGYSFVDIGPVKLSAEVEYMKGLLNISPNSSSTLHLDSVTANLLVRFTL